MSTVKNYLAAIRHFQIALSLGDPDMGNMPQLEYVIKGLKRSATYSSKRSRLPITLDLLCQLKSVWQAWDRMRQCCGRL